MSVHTAAPSSSGSSWHLCHTFSLFKVELMLIQFIFGPAENSADDVRCKSRLVAKTNTATADSGPQLVPKLQQTEERKSKLFFMSGKEKQTIETQVATVRVLVVNAACWDDSHHVATSADAEFQVVTHRERPSLLSSFH